MKSFLLLFILSASTLYAQTYYMNVRMKSGTNTTIPVQEIQKLTFSDTKTVGVERMAAAIKAFTLLLSYPDPFNPNPPIEYELQIVGDVEIKIFNFNGQLVKTLARNQQIHSTHRVVWDGRNNEGQTVASGRYIYQVAFENSMLVRKIFFIK